MSRTHFIELAKSGLRMPIGSDMALREKADAEQILRDGARLGAVVADAARRYHTPLAMPVMDLMLEKAHLLRQLGISEKDIPTWHFSACPTDEQVDAIRKGIAGPLDVRMKANVEAVRHVATTTDLVPFGMSIGPFSLMTKLVADPITPVYIAGTGVTAEEDPDVKMIETILDLALETIFRYMDAQIDAGAKGFFIAEPAANKVYISPNQMAEGSDVFERFVLKYNKRIQAHLESRNVDFVFHCCGEITDEILKGFCSLRPAMLSLGSSRKLWEDAAIVPDDIVLFGNLPSKKFFSEELKVSELDRMANELVEKMAATGHPFILSSECDVLHVDGCCDKINEKLKAIFDKKVTVAAPKAKHFCSHCARELEQHALAS